MNTKLRNFIRKCYIEVLHEDTDVEKKVKDLNKTISNDLKNDKEIKPDAARIALDGASKKTKTDLVNDLNSNNNKT